MNRLNRMCAFCPLYMMKVDRERGVGWLEKVGDPYPRMAFAIRDAVRRPSRTTFDDLPDRVEDGE